MAVCSKQPRVRCKDSQAILNALEPHIKTPHCLGLYTTKLDGSPNHELLGAWVDMLVSLRRVATNGALLPDAVTKAMKQIADTNEDSWHLANEAPKWIEDNSNRIRAMSRHVQQGILKIPKGKPPPTWLAPFITAETTGQSDAGVAQESSGASSAAGSATAALHGCSHAEEWDFGYDDDMQARTVQFNQSR